MITLLELEQTNIKAKKTYIEGKKRDRENEEIIIDINIDMLVGTIV